MCTLLQLRNALHGEFVFDDMYAIVQNPDVYSSQPWLALFEHDFWGFPLESEKSHKSYRPLTTLTFRWQMMHTNGTELSAVSTRMHQVNVALHALNSGLSVFLFRSLGLSVSESSFASLLFACHPVHVEAVASLVGRAELLAALMTICSIILWNIPLLWPLSFILAACALFCKETAALVALPMISSFQLMDWMCSKAYSEWKLLTALKTVLPLMLLSLLLTLRLLLHGGLQAGWFSLQQFSLQTVSNVGSSRKTQMGQQG